MRVTPSIEFRIDRPAYGARIEKIFKDLKDQSVQQDEDGPQD